MALKPLEVKTAHIATALFTVFLAMLVALMSGCRSTQYGYQSESREWKIPYFENVMVNTEPQGAKVYCQDEYMGISPINLENSEGHDGVRVIESGTYPIQWTHIPEWSDGPFSESHDIDHRRTGADTTWSGKLQFSIASGTWTIKAFKEGYEPAIYTITLSSDDNVFKQACKDLKPNSNGALPKIKIVGDRTILLTLKPLPETFPVQGKGQQQQQQQTVVIPGGEAGKEKEKVGTVIVTSNVENAEVFVDGLFVGNTPANLKLKDGVHIIEVKKTGYKTYKRELRVLGDSETSLRAELEKE